MPIVVESTSLNKYNHWLGLFNTYDCVLISP
jgi:hypothetical protein